MSNELPQLFMRIPNLKYIPDLILPEGYGIHTHEEGKEKEWEDLIEDAFGQKYSFDACIRNGGDYLPERVFYITKDGKDIATCTAVEKEMFKGQGWLRMAGSLKSARGQGGGRLALIACLHALKERGFNSAVLSTDDFRLPAISLYLSLGFLPLITHESHASRWAEVFKNIQK